jgi:hypothetical protein
MRVRSLLAVALVAPALAWAAPSSGTGSTGEPGAAPASSTLLPSHPVRKRARGAATARSAAPRRRTALQARTVAAERAATARVVPASGVIHGYPEPAGRPSLAVAGDRARTGFELGGFAGYEAANVSGLSYRLDGAVPVLDVGPKIRLSAVVSLGYSRLSGRMGFLELTADVFKLVPAARFTVPLGARFSVFADVGFGVAFVSAHLASTDPAAVSVTAPSDRSLNAMARVGLGAWYHATRWLKVGAMAEMDPILGDFAYAGAAAQNTFLVQGGMMLRL